MGPSISSNPGGFGHLSASQAEILTDFLKSNGGNYIGALAFHHYYISAYDATLNAFLNASILNNFVGCFENLQAVTLENNYNGPIWLGETSSAYNSGAQNLSNTYAAGFPWLDKLGLAAVLGIDVVLRQDFWGGNYGLLDNDHLPLPDYWLSLIFKSLVGGTVYNVRILQDHPDLRMYAASTTKNIGTVLYGVYLGNESGQSVHIPEWSNSLYVTLYVLKGAKNDLQSKISTLNGKLLIWNTHEPGPNFESYVYYENYFSISGPTQFFAVLEEIRTSCLPGWYKESVNSRKCVKIINETMPLFGAKFDCGAYGSNASILTIENSFENSEILKQISANNCDQFYVGLVRNGNGTNWIWSNNSNTTYVNWKAGFPTNDITKNCVTFDAKSGTWANVDCDGFQCYICQDSF